MKKRIYISCLAIISLVACKNQTEVRKNPVPSADKLQELNLAMAKNERKQIENFITEKGWDVEKTGSGLYYWQYKVGEGDSVKMGQQVEVNLVVSLLNGDTCYNYEAYGSEKFVVEQQSKEAGLHELVQLLTVGSKAQAVLPSHLAYGVTGDMDKIPPRASVVYDIEVLNVR